MYINNKLAAGFFVFVALCGYAHYYSQAQTLYSNIIIKTSDSKGREFPKREHEFSHKFTSNTPIMRTSTMEHTGNLHNTTTYIQGEVYNQGDLSLRNSYLHDIAHIYDDIKRKANDETDSRRELNISSLPPDLYKMGKSVFDLLPKAYLPGYKSPCWVLGGELKCLHYFYLLGMPKCGTTDLWDKIVLHPEVKYTEKEPHWWARGRLRRGTLGGYTSRSKNMVKTFTLQPSLKSRLVIGDGSASTFWDNNQWETWDGRRYEGPQYVTADIIHATQPDAKLIVILRNPVSRVYSGYLYFNPKLHVRTSPEHFHSEMVGVIDRFSKCLQTMSFRGCTYSINQIHNKRLYARLLVGLYAVYVRDWLRVYPRDQLKIMRLEDWHGNCTGVLPEVFDFLNLENKSEKDISQFCQKRVQNTNTVKFKADGDMLPKTRKLLEDFYEGPNKELSLLLGSDKYLWRS